MIKIEYPEYPYKIKNENGKEFIFDPVRKQWIILTPEEWVRQNFLQYLLLVKKYPAALMAVEKEIRLGELIKRCDIVVYNRSGLPLLITECKSMDIPINMKTVEQIIRYNITLGVPYLVVTNGTYCFAFGVTNGSVNALEHIPEWKD